MWRNWNPLNPPINHQDSEDEQNNYESADDDPEQLVSPHRPHQSPTASPRALLRPDPPRVDEVLEEVQQQLSGLPNREQRAANRNAVRRAQEVAAAAAEVVEVAEHNPIANMPNIVAFEDEDGIDEAGAHKEACNRVEKVNWDPKDLPFTFGQIERKTAAAGVKKNFTKFQVLSEVLPKEVCDEVKSLLRKDEADFPDKNAYKLLKNEVLRIFGPRPEDPIERALGRVMTGKPSQLARALADDICKKELDCQCCPAVVATLWKRHLPSNVRAGIASSVLKKDTFDAIVKLADDIHASSAPSAYSVAAVRTAPEALDETQPGLQYPVDAEVNAIRNGRGRGNQGGRGGRGGRGNRGNRGGRGGGQSQNQNQQNQASGGGPKHKGTKHPDLPAGEWNGCSMHFRWGRSAFFCSEPGTCPWKNVFTTKQ